MRGFKDKVISYISILAIIGTCSGCQKEDKVDTIEEKKVVKSEFQDPKVLTEGSQEEVIGGDANEQEDIEEEPKEAVLNIGCDDFRTSYQPVQNYHNDDVVLNQINLPLVTMDRGGEPILKGKDGQTIPYQNKDYFYEGLCNIDIDYNKEMDRTTYTIDLRDDVCFSDGVKLNADDLIFSLYLFCDPRLGHDFRNNKIVGLANYANDSTLVEEITKEKVEERMQNPTDSLKEIINERYLRQFARKEIGFYSCIWNHPRFQYLKEGFDEVKDLFAEKYKDSRRYDSTLVETCEQVIDDIIHQYDGDYQTIADIYGDSDYFYEDIYREAELELMNEALEESSEKVDYIEGIKKISDTKVTITTYGYDKNFIYQLSIPVYPLHYYGDFSLYDYEKHQFGFHKGNYQLESEKIAHPLGAGPFEYEGLSDGVVTLKKNEKYYRGTPKIDRVRFIKVPEEERVYEMRKQHIDLTKIIGYKLRYSEIELINKNKGVGQESIGMRKIGEYGTGYIGMNVKSLKIGEDAFSEESIALRKAIATLIAIYREESFREFAGFEIDVIDYPGSREAWYAQRDTSKDPCYSKNFTGSSIFSREMDYQERYDSAIRAAKDYFVQAGYTYDAVKQRLVAAPHGGKMKFTIAISHAETHPVYGLLLKAQEAFKSIGIDFEIYDETDDFLYWNVKERGLTDLWCGGWEVTYEPELLTKYGKRNLNEQLVNQLEKIDHTIDYEKRTSLCKEFFDSMLDQAIDIPLYQMNNAILYNTDKLNAARVSNDYTLFWNWEQDLCQLEVINQ